MVYPARLDEPHQAAVGDQQLKVVCLQRFILRIKLPAGIAIRNVVGSFERDSVQLNGAFCELVHPNLRPVGGESIVWHSTVFTHPLISPWGEKYFEKLQNYCEYFQLGKLDKYASANEDGTSVCID